MAEGISSVRLGDIIQEFGLEVLNRGTNYENVPLRKMCIRDRPHPVYRGDRGSSAKIRRGQSPRCDSEDKCQTNLPKKNLTGPCWWGWTPSACPGRRTPPRRLWRLSLIQIFCPDVRPGADRHPGAGPLEAGPVLGGACLSDGLLGRDICAVLPGGLVQLSRGLSLIHISSMAGWLS